MWGLTVPLCIAPCELHESQLFVVQVCQAPQILVFAFVGERVHALIAVVKVC